MDCIVWGDAEFEYDRPFLGTSLTWYLGAYEHFYIPGPDVWITTSVLVAVPYCVPRGMCEYLLRLMELDFASLSLQKGLELHGHHWQADAVLAVFPQVGNERKPA